MSSVRILTLAELPRSVVPQLGALGWLDGDAPQDLRFVRRVQRSGLPMSDYYGVYAVEGDQLLAHVEALDLVVTTQEGPVPALGLADVLTRPDAIGRGLATRLIGEVHRRARAHGARWSLLWTHRTWGAHRLYERLGYRDVFSPPAALRKVPRRYRTRRSPGYSWERVTRTASRRLERIASAGRRGRLGFVPEDAAPFRARFRLGFRSWSDHRVLRRGSEDVGYAYLSIQRDSLTVHEVVVTDPVHAVPMISALEAEAAGRWVALGTTTFVRDAAPALVSRGYLYFASSHRVLMARPLSDRSGALVRRSFLGVFDDPRFSCHRGDMF